MDNKITRLAPNAHIIDLATIHFEEEKIQNITTKFKNEGYFLGSLISGAYTNVAYEQLNIVLALMENFSTKDNNHNFAKEITNFKIKVNSDCYKDLNISNNSDIDLIYESSKNFPNENNCSDEKILNISDDISETEIDNTSEQPIFSGQINQKDGIYFLANQDKEIVGGIYFENTAQECWHIALLTEQEFLPVGAGTLLFNIALQYIQSVKTENITVHI